MKLTKKEIEKLAALARLELTAEEKEKFSMQISSILEYAEQIKEVNTDKIKDFSHLNDRKNIFREDVSQEFKEVKKLIEQFPDKSGNLNKTKAVLE